MLRMTLCEVVKGKMLLLKKANRGISKGKWNGLGGKIESGESEKENAVREIEEESGLRAKRLERRGTIYFSKGSRGNRLGRISLFVCNNFSGQLKAGSEGELKWFDTGNLPYDRMWDDDRYWMPLLMRGYAFEAEFIYDKKMEKVIALSIRKIRKV